MKQSLLAIHNFFKEAQYAPLILFVFVVCLWCLPSSCKDKVKPPKDIRTDTAWTVVAYSFDWNLNDHRLSTARRIIQDTYKLIPVDSADGEVTSKKRWVKDTTYLVPIFEPVLDSLKRPLKMISGKDSTKLQWARLPIQFLLVDYNKNFK